MKSLKCTKCGSYNCAVDIGDFTYYANEGLEWLDPSDNVGQTLEEESLEGEILGIRCIDCDHHFVWVVGKGFAEVKLFDDVLSAKDIEAYLSRAMELKRALESNELADAVVRTGLERLVTTLQCALPRDKDKEEKKLHKEYGSANFVHQEEPIQE